MLRTEPGRLSAIRDEPTGLGHWGLARFESKAVYWRPCQPSLVWPRLRKRDASPVPPLPMGYRGRCSPPRTAFGAEARRGGCDRGDRLGPSCPRRSHLGQLPHGRLNQSARSAAPSRLAQGSPRPAVAAPLRVHSARAPVIVAYPSSRRPHGSESDTRSWRGGEVKPLPPPFSQDIQHQNEHPDPSPSCLATSIS